MYSRTFKNATPRLNLYIFWIKNSIVMNLSVFYSSTYIIAVYLLKILLSSDKCIVFKTSSVEDRSHLLSETIDISHFFFCFYLLQIDKMSNLIT